MEIKIQTIKNNIAVLENEELRKEFAKEIYDAQTSQFGQTIVYYDFESHGIRCEALAEGSILSNTAFLAILPQSLDFEEMSEEEYKVFVNNLLQDMKNINNWIVFDEKGEKIL